MSCVNLKLFQLITAKFTVPLGVLNFNKRIWLGKNMQGNGDIYERDIKPIISVKHNNRGQSFECRRLWTRVPEVEKNIRVQYDCQTHLY